MTEDLRERPLFLDRGRGSSIVSHTVQLKLEHVLQLLSSFLQARMQAETHSPALNFFSPSLTLCQPTPHFAEPPGLWRGFSDSGVSPMTPIPHEPLLSMVLLPYQEYTGTVDGTKLNIYSKLWCCLHLLRQGSFHLAAGYCGLDLLGRTSSFQGKNMRFLRSPVLTIHIPSPKQVGFTPEILGMGNT